MKLPHPQISKNTSENGEKEKEKSVEDVHKPVAPFPNRLKSYKSNAQMEKILQIFNQVKSMFHFLMPYNKCLHMQNF